MKIIAFYLPQFHEIPENNEWWGKGFTEWVNVKKAEPMFEWHNQPRIPVNNNYYNLLDDEVKIWQAETAKKYGIYGFCYYHYWFDGHMLLEKPMEQMLENPKIDIPFCICWANENWTNAWVSADAKTLISQTYGDRDEWVKHYHYLSKFFKDSRYIKDNNKPLMVIYEPKLIKCIKEMIQCWQELAIQDGFDGINFAYQAPGLDFPEKLNNEDFKYNIEMQPIYGNIMSEEKSVSLLKKIVHKITKLLNVKNIDTIYRGLTGPKLRNYDTTWKAILSAKPISKKSIPCAFVDFDNTPRRQRQGWLFKGVSTQKFQKYFSALLRKAKEEYKTDFMFIFAWNEWAEGGYLEPDTKNEYGYLEAIKKALDDEA